MRGGRKTKVLHPLLATVHMMMYLKSRNEASSTKSSGRMGHMFVEGLMLMSQHAGTSPRAR